MLRVLLRITALSLLATGLPAQAETSPQDQAAFFGLDKRWDVRITITEDDLAALYPKRAVRMGLSQRGLFKYSKAAVVIAGRKFEKVGVRFKGNSTYWTSSGHLKKSLKLDFNRFVEGQEFLGLRKLNLQNNLTDVSQIREAVSYAVFRGAGVPACRTAFARVYLTVVGEFENEYVGNYTIVEQIDKQFLAHHFGQRDGLIVKPEGRVMPWLGDEWDEDYDKAYIPKTKFKKRHSRPMVAMAKLAQGDPEAFLAGIEQVLDVSEFLNFTAVTTFLVNMDNPFRIAHNFYMAVPEGHGKVVWLPWDLNLSIGGFGMGRRQSGSLYRPSSLPLFTRLIEEPKYRKIYETHMRNVAKGSGSPESMAALFRTARATTEEAIAAEADRKEFITKSETERPGLMSLMGRRRTGSSRSLATSQDRFAAERGPKVLEELEEGFPENASAPTNMFGSFGRVGTRRARDTMVALRETLVRSKVIRWKKTPHLDDAALRAAAADLFRKFDADSSGAVSRNEILTLLRSQRGEDQMRSEGRRILRKADTDSDRKVSESELVAIYVTGLGSWDKDADGKLSREELTGEKR